jgi:hypothetical protein
VSQHWLRGLRVACRLGVWEDHTPFFIEVLMATLLFDGADSYNEWKLQQLMEENFMDWNDLDIDSEFPTEELPSIVREF